MTFDKQAARSMIAAYHPGFPLPDEVRVIKDALDRIEKLEDELIQKRADALACAEYEPPMTMAGLKALAREQLHEEGKL